MKRETLIQKAKYLGIEYISKYKYDVINPKTKREGTWTGIFKNINTCNIWANKWLVFLTSRGHTLKRIKLLPDPDKLRARVTVKVLLLKFKSKCAVKALLIEEMQRQEIETALELNRR